MPFQMYYSNIVNIRLIPNHMLQFHLYQCYQSNRMAYICHLKNEIKKIKTINQTNVALSYFLSPAVRSILLRNFDIDHLYILHGTYNRFCNHLRRFHNQSQSLIKKILILKFTERLTKKGVKRTYLFDSIGIGHAQIIQSCGLPYVAFPWYPSIHISQ